MYARRIRERIQPSLLVEAFREGKERSICSAASKDLVDIIEDQVREQSVVWEQEAATWKNIVITSVVATGAAQAHRLWRTESGHKQQRRGRKDLGRQS